MNTSSKCLLAICLVFVANGQASASLQALPFATAPPYVIDPTTLTEGTDYLTSDDNSNFNADEVETEFGLVDLTELYKADVGAADTGSFASSYETTYANTATDPEDATVDYISGSIMNSIKLYLLVKDGNQDPAQYLFDVSNWDRTTDLLLENFWAGAGAAGRGAISHIAFYGGEGPDTQDVVPEATSLMIWATLAMACGFGARRRRLA